jgi:hypothetical protein
VHASANRGKAYSIKLVAITVEKLGLAAWKEGDPGEGE